MIHPKPSYLKPRSVVGTVARADAIGQAWHSFCAFDATVCQ